MNERAGASLTGWTVNWKKRKGEEEGGGEERRRRRRREEEEEGEERRRRMKEEEQQILYIIIEEMVHNSLSAQSARWSQTGQSPLLGPLCGLRMNHFKYAQCTLIRLLLTSLPVSGCLESCHCDCTSADAGMSHSHQTVLIPQAPERLHDLSLCVARCHGWWLTTRCWLSAVTLIP